MTTMSTMLSPHSNPAFRRMVWTGTIPISLSLDTSELPPGSDNSLDTTYMIVPRISYLPLLIEQIRRNLVELVFDDTALSTINEKEWWFEWEGQPLKWHWPIGLLYDYHTGNAAHLPWKIKLRLSKPPLDKLHTNSSVENCKISFMSMIKEADFVRYGSTKRVVNLRKQEQDALWQGVVLHDFDAYWTVAQKLVTTTAPTISTEVVSDTTGQARQSAFRSASLNVPVADEKTSSGSIMSQTNESQISLAPSMVSTMTSDSGAAVPTGNTIRSIPIRILLPDQAPVVQEPVPPLLDEGRPATLSNLLSSLFPLLFPPPPSFSSFQAANPPLAFAVIQGVRMPLQTEIGWLGSTMISPDGWVTVVVGLLQHNESP